MTCEQEKAVEGKKGLKALEAAAVFILRGKKRGGADVLLAERQDPQAIEFRRLSPPGGQFEQGEDSMLCVIREAKEEGELKIKPEDLHQLGPEPLEFKFTLSEATFLYHPFFAIWSEEMGEPQKKKGEKKGLWQWIGLDQLLKLAGEKKLSAAVEELIDDLQQAYDYYVAGQLEKKARRSSQRTINVPRLLPESTALPDQKANTNSALEL